MRPGISFIRLTSHICQERKNLTELVGWAINIDPEVEKDAEKELKVMGTIFYIKGVISFNVKEKNNLQVQGNIIGASKCINWNMC